MKQCAPIGFHIKENNDGIKEEKCVGEKINIFSSQICSQFQYGKISCQQGVCRSAGGSIF